MLRRTSLSLLMLLAIGACSDDSGPRVATIDQLRVVKVSGDQSSPVPDQVVAASPIRAVAGGVALALTPDGYTSEPLVARVEVTSAARGGTGPSSIVAPGTLVHWHIPAEAGKLYGATTATDDSAHVVNRWAPGTKAGSYQVTAGRLVGADIVTDATWEVVVEPGAPMWFGYLIYENVIAGAPLDLTAPRDGFKGRDKYQNSIPDAVIVANYTPDWEIRGPRPNANPACDQAPLHSQGTGWTIPSAPEAHSWGYCLDLFLNGRRLGGGTIFPVAANP